MTAAKHVLLGSYKTPRFKYGDRVICGVRGEVVIVGLSAVCIPWPFGRPGHFKQSLVVYKDLARAVRRESAAAICEHWGVTAQTVSKWRKALGVGQMLARAQALRQAGVELREHSDERPPASLLTEAKALATQLMAKHGLSDWQFAFNTNKRRAGVCRYPVLGRPGRIELSKHYVLRNPENEVRDTVPTRNRPRPRGSRTWPRRGLEGEVHRGRGTAGALLQRGGGDAEEAVAGHLRGVWKGARPAPPAEADDRVAQPEVWEGPWGVGVEAD